MSLPAAPLEWAQRLGSGLYISFNTFLLGSRGTIAQLEEHLARVVVFMDLGAGHWLIFLSFTQISVGNCIQTKQIQVSFQSNFKNKCKLWCWARPANADPYLSPKFLTEERTMVVGLAALALQSRGWRKEKLICQLFHLKTPVHFCDCHSHCQCQDFYWLQK